MILEGTTGGDLAKELAIHFQKVVPEVIVKREISVGDAFVVDLSALSIQTSEEAIHRNFEIFDSARQYANQEKEQSMYVFVGQSDFSTRTVSYGAGYLGLAKTAYSEWPDTFVKAIGFETPKAIQEVARTLFLEVMTGGLSNEVFYDQSFRRFELQVKEKQEEAISLDLMSGATFLVTGGGRGVTADCIIALAEKQRLNFAILGRSELFEEPEFLHGVEESQLKGQLVKSFQQEGKKIVLEEIAKQANRIVANREIRKTLKMLESLGAHATYYATDVNDEKSLSTTMESIVAQYGSVEGVIHGAGVLADKYIKDKTDDQFQRVFDTKVKGFQNLISVTKDQELKYVACFTSVAGRFGNTGQCDYAMANEVLNKLCVQLQTEKGERCLVKALNWGPWEGGMVTPELKEHFESRGIGVIGRKEGAEAFVAELVSKGQSVEVVIGNGLHNWTKAQSKQDTLSVWVQQATFPILKDHVIKGTAVMPMVGIIKHAEAIGNYFFETKEITVRNVNVLRGIKLTEYKKEGEWLTYRLTKQGTDQLLIEVYQENENLPNYKLVVVPEAYQHSVLSALTKTSTTYTKEKLVTQPGYFHGEDLQMIDSLEFTSTGSDFTVSQFSEADFKLKLMDGAYQAGSIQAGIMKEGAQAIPMGCRSFRWFKEPELHAPLQYKLRVTSQDEVEFASNVQLINRDTQEVYFETRDVKVVTYDVSTFEEVMD